MGDKACALYSCKAILLAGETDICSDCALVVDPLTDAAVEAERERCAKMVEGHILEDCHDVSTSPVYRYCENYGCYGLRELVVEIRKPPESTR